MASSAWWCHAGGGGGLVVPPPIPPGPPERFSDFTCVRAPLLVRFLPASRARWGAGWAGLVGAGATERPGVPAWLARRHAEETRMLSAFAAVAALLVSLVEWTGRSERAFLDGRAWVWIAADAALLALVGWYLVRERPPVEEHQLRMPSASWLLVVP